MTARVRLYAAMSIDGCLADAEGGIAWLAPFDAQDYGMVGFLSGIGALLTGRATYDQVRDFADWPYPGKRVVVLTHRPLDSDPPEGVEAAAGDLAAIVTRLRVETTGDIWLLGGAAVAQAALAQGLVDTLEIFVIPVTLGDGIRLFGREGVPRGWRLDAARPFPNGVVGLEYRHG
ncbi:dihydrofolate reductase family protein [Roseomonas sp. CAU 1739]|uniref:dihydrofolate reductase family protein n=1 Tax=Roseomonas sp. CAU 1739 TaxID=3140364 RepID=UPI00325BF87D